MPRHFLWLQESKLSPKSMNYNTTISLNSFSLRRLIRRVTVTVRKLLCKLVPISLMGALTHCVCFLFFFRELLMFWCVFRWLVRLGNFSACWRQANITPIPKCPPFSSAMLPLANCWQISITSVLSKMFERLVSVRLARTIYGMQWCASNHPVFHSGELADRLCRRLHFDGCCSIIERLS